MDSDHKLTLGIIALCALVVIVLIVSITGYNISELHNGIRPQVVQHYNWPN